MKRIGLVVLLLIFGVVGAVFAYENYFHNTKPALTSREFKILLNPSVCINRTAGYQALWGTITAVANDMGVTPVPANAPYREEEDEVTYLDTPAMDLYKQHYILRKRVEYSQGNLSSHCELMLKYRHTDLQQAVATSVKPAPSFEGKEKMEQDVNMDGNKIGSLKGVYSHSSSVGRIQAPAEDSVAAYAAIFPSLKMVQTDPQKPLLPVNNKMIREVTVSLGTLEFQPGLPAAVEVSLWYPVAGQLPEIAELSFHYHTKKASKEAMNASEVFFKALQKALGDQLEPGMTKTDFVYGIGIQE